MTDYVGDQQRMAPKHAMLHCAANHPRLVVACDIFTATSCIQKIAQRIAAVSSAGAALQPMVIDEGDTVCFRSVRFLRNQTYHAMKEGAQA
jgi:hypothetical protein